MQFLIPPSVSKIRVIWWPVHGINPGPPSGPEDWKLRWRAGWAGRVTAPISSFEFIPPPGFRRADRFSVGRPRHGTTCAPPKGGPCV